MVYCFQSIDNIPGRITKDRTKLWGTDQVVLDAKELIDTPFAVINVDDYYGILGRRSDMKERDRSIDLMKTILVIFMIMAHVIQFFPSVKIAHIFSVYVNLTTFSGFMFSFGFVCYKAYIKNDNKKRVGKRLLFGFIKTICAYYISGIAYTILITKNFTLKSIIDVLVFKCIPGYSEFLLSFALIYPLMYISINFFKKMNNVHYFIMAGISLILTLIDYNVIKNSILGALIGTNTFACFPIIQYMSYFLAGMYLASNNKVVEKYMVIISCLGSIGFISYCFYFGQIPKRFPPSAAWIMGGYLFVYIYFIVSKKSLCYLNKINCVFEIGCY